MFIAATLWRTSHLVVTVSGLSDKTTIVTSLSLELKRGGNGRIRVRAFWPGKHFTVKYVCVPCVGTPMRSYELFFSTRSIRHDPNELTTLSAAIAGDVEASNATKNVTCNTRLIGP